MDNVRYVNTRGETINLVKPPLIINTKQFREFVIEVKGGRITSAGEKIHSVPAAVIGTKKIRDKVIDSLLYDAEVNEQGRLYVNDWFVYCNFSGTESVIAETETAARIDLQISIPENEWLKETVYNLSPDSESDADGLNTPFNFPFNYSTHKKSIKKIYNNAVSDADFVFEFKGTAENVEFSVDNTVYTVNSAIAEGETFYLNTYKKEVFKFFENQTIDLFPVSSDETYIFSRIPTGEHSISWTGDYSVKLTLLERRRFPKWI